VSKLHRVSLVIPAFETFFFYFEGEWYHLFSFSTKKKFLANFDGENFKGSHWNPVLHVGPVTHFFSLVSQSTSCVWTYKSADWPFRFRGSYFCEETPISFPLLLFSTHTSFCFSTHISARDLVHPLGVLPIWMLQLLRPWVEFLWKKANLLISFFCWVHFSACSFRSFLS